MDEVIDSYTEKKKNWRESEDQVMCQAIHAEMMKYEADDNNIPQSTNDFLL